MQRDFKQILMQSETFYEETHSAQDRELLGGATQG